MSVPAEFAKEFASFPAALRALVEAELDAGNFIAAIEHGFPAAPCGAFLRLANAAGEARRTSTSEVDFYARNNSNHAGEFTTAERRFFVLEPPLPPPPDPDMDAIRNAHEPRPTPIARLAERSVSEYALPAALAPAESPLTNSETPTGWTRVLHFCDRRAPHEMQFALERKLMALFTPRVHDGRLRLSAVAHVNGVRFDVELGFDAALERENHYRLKVSASWDEAETYRDYFRNSSDSWFSLWVRDLMPMSPAPRNIGLQERYAQLREAALAAERHLDSVPAVQRAIVEGVMRGGSFAESHKEGGTNIYWRVDRFVRSDYGESSEQAEFRNDADFLKMLWNFCRLAVTRSAEKRAPTELEAWKLILRRMQSP